MKRAFFVFVSVLAQCGVASAQVQMWTVPAATAPMSNRDAAWRMPVPTPAVPAPTAHAPFGCEARAPNVCHFRIFYTRGDRIVILPAGMKEKKIPVVTGGDYCMTLNKPPVSKCTRKVINDKYNS
jgi:hypothetical protein